MFTEDEARQLLTLLHKYVENYTPDLPQTIPALAADLAMSMDTTTDEDDRMRQEIEERYP